MENEQIKEEECYNFYEYLVKKFDLSFVAGLFNEGTATLKEWDLMVRLLGDLLRKKEKEN